MYPIAHFASAVVVNRLLHRDRSVAPAAVGALFPDAVDKTLAWVLRVTPSSHYIAHTPIAAGALSLLTAKLFGPKAARSVASAYVTHLVCDDAHHGRVPWLLPFSQYRRLPRQRNWRLHAAGLLLELPALALLLAMARSDSRDAGPG